MNITSTQLSYAKTGFFSKIVVDYIAGDEKLSSFYYHPVSLKGIQSSIKNRKKYVANRQLLVDELQKQYANTDTTNLVKDNIRKLLSPDTFTICTAHQPNIFTGPLYFIYKILHAAKLASQLKKELPQYEFVPVFYMGSEDADLDELNNISIQGNKLVWATKQTGAVGRMKVDDELLGLLASINGQIAVLPHGKELVRLFTDCYKKGQTIQQSTFELVNKLFSEFGVVVLIPDNTALKAAFTEVATKELLEEFSFSLLKNTAEELSANYKIQAGGRDINLFYLLDDKRERIEKKDSQFVVENLQLTFSKEEILNQLKNYPERFSPNVILRGVFQEMILPNIAFIGGGGEIAYWLELKKVFDAVNVPYPMLVLRNSFMILSGEQNKKATKLGLKVADLFLPEQELLNRLVLDKSNNHLQLKDEITGLQNLYGQLKLKAMPVDTTLLAHIDSLCSKAQKRVEELEKKIIRAEKKKYEAEQRQIQWLKQSLFPNGLQERVENVAYFYAFYGKEWLTMLYNHSFSLEQQFIVLSEK